jgi:hypothetical protein
MNTVIKKCKIKIGLIAMLVILATGLAAPPQSTAYPALNDFANWSALWWQWAYTQPWQTNPVWDTSTSAPYAGLNQQGPVYFLAGHFDKSFIDNFPVIRGTSTNPLSIPSNKYLFFPVVATSNVNGIEVRDPNDPNIILITVDDETTVRTGAAKYIDSVINKTCTVTNGNILAFSRAITPNLNVPPPNSAFGITITLPNDSVLEHIYWDIYGYSHVPAGDWDKSVADGWYAMLEPLSPGAHTIHFDATIFDASSQQNVLVQDVTYYINVAPIPGTLFLLGSGFLGMLGYGIRKSS